MTPRPHAEIIKQWAEGHNVQYRRPGSNEWVDSPDPAFVSDYEYRVKPARVYPESRLSSADFLAMYGGRVCHDLGFKTLLDISCITLRHAIDNGQVVPMSEVQEVARELAKQMT